MAYSKISYIGDGSTTSYTTPSYIEKSHITVMLDGVQSFEHSWTGPTTITFNTAPSAGAVIEIVRNSSQQTRLVNYQQPSPLDAETLNRDSKQAFYMAQEALDEASLALHRTPDGDSYDAEGNQIINVGSPTNGNDAATKSYVDIAVATGVPGGPITLFTVADYTELRGLTTAAYAANRVFVTSPAPGEFWHDVADTTSADDGGVIIVDADGRRWKRLEFFSGYVCPTWWGAKPGGDATDNTTAIQAAVDNYAGVNPKVNKILFTKRGTYAVNGTITIQGAANVRFPFTIDLGASELKQQTDNIPLIDYVGGTGNMWKIENGHLGFSPVQPATNTNAVLIRFSGGPGDGATGNGPNNGVISRIDFGRCAIAIGVGPKDATDSAYTIWDVRVEYCKFVGAKKHAIQVTDDPFAGITAKNITIRSCYIHDEYNSDNLDPILIFRNIMLLNIDDLEVIQVHRPIMYCNIVTADIRTVSIENPSTSSPPITNALGHLFRFFKSPATINGLNLMTLRADIGAGNRIPIIFAESDTFNDIPVTVGMVDLFRLEGVSGGFTLFGGNQEGRIIHTTPAVYHETDPTDCTLFEYNSSLPNNAVIGKSYLTYYGNTTKAITHTSATYYVHTVTPEVTNLVVNGTPTANRTIEIRPYGHENGMSSSPNIGPGAYLRVRQVTSGPYTFTVTWSTGSITMPANKKGTITIAFVAPNTWQVVDYVEM